MKVFGSNKALEVSEKVDFDGDISIYWKERDNRTWINEADAIRLVELLRRVFSLEG